MQCVNTPYITKPYVALIRKMGLVIAPCELATGGKIKVVELPAKMPKMDHIEKKHCTRFSSSQVL